MIFEQPHFLAEIFCFWILFNIFFIFSMLSSSAMDTAMAVGLSFFKIANFSFNSFFQKDRSWKGKDIPFFRQLFAVCAELVADDLVVVFEIERFGGNEMEQYARAFDMPQKFHAEPFAGGRSLYQSRNVGEDKLIVHAKVRLERREWIVRNFAVAFVSSFSILDFPPFGSPTKPTSAMSFNSKRNVNSSPGNPGLEFLRRRVVRRTEIKIAAAAEPAFRENDLLADMSRCSHQRPS